MKIKIIEIKNSKDNLKKILCKQLKKKIFHITSQSGYEGIIKDGAIYPSNHKNIKKHIWGFSENGRYFTNKNCISVVDFYHNKDKKLVINAIRKYRFYDIHSVAKGKIAYFFVLKTKIYKNVISWKDIEKDWKKNPAQQIVPHLESGIKDKILLSDVDYIIRVETNEKYIDFENLYNKILKG